MAENNIINDIIKYNRVFVSKQGYKDYVTSKYPDKKIAVISCMDTRLTELLPAALGAKNGDIKIIKNAGGVISNPFGSVVRSILIAIFELGVDTVLVIGHTDCGVQHMDPNEMMNHMRKRGVSQEAIDMMHYCGVDFENWLSGFDDVETSVRETAELLIHHPLIPDDVHIGGFVMDSVTGELAEIVID